MPVPVLKKYAEESGKTLKQAEKAWEESKEEADKKFDKRDGHYWAYVNILTQRKLGIEDKKKKKEKTERKSRRK